MPRIKKQHIVSVTLLKRWTQNGKLRQVDLKSRKHSLALPTKVAYSRDFSTPTQVQHTEAVWHEIETRAGVALKNLAEGREFDETAVKDLIALHLIRSNDMIDACHHLFNNYQPIARLRNLSFADLQRHALERTGLYIVGTEGALMEQQAITKQLYQHFREDLSSHLPKLLAQVQGYFRSLNLEILTCGSVGELVIGDTPAIPIDWTGTRTGLDSGVWLRDAAAVFMPLTPGILASVGLADATAPLTSSAIERLNLIQCQRATRRVFCSPGSETHAWILAEHTKFLDSMNDSQGKN